LILTTQLLTAQSESLKNKKKHTKKNANDIITEFSEFLKLPNTTASPSNLRDNAFIMSMMYRKALKNVQL
jgi:predicted nucleic acid-binding protein